MHGSIGDPSREDKASAIALVFAYIDTIECFARTRFSIELKNALRKATGRKVWDEWTGYGWLLFVNGPTSDAINILEQHWRPRDSICALHIALEFDAINGTTRDELVRLIDYHLHVRHSRASDRPLVIGETRYSVDTALRRQRGQRKASKIGVSYHDRPGKLDGELDKPRYEIRLETSRAIRMMGFHTPADLLTLKPREFLAKVLMIKQHGPMLEKIVQRSIKIECAKPSPMPHAERRVRTLIRRGQADTLTGFAHAFPRQFERLKAWACINIVEALQFTPMVRDGKHVVNEVGEMCHVSQATSLTPDQEVGELHCLLPPRPRAHRERLIIRERL